MKKYIKPEVEMFDVNAQEMLIALSSTEADPALGGDSRILDFQDIDLGNSLDSETLDLSFDFENM